MKIPHRIDHNTFELYKPSYETLYLISEENRQVKAEDLIWDRDLFPSLLTLCMRVLLNNFEKFQVLDRIPAQEVDVFYETIPTTLPLELTVPLIPDGIFWQRCYEERWKRIHQYRREPVNWKSRYLERWMQDYLEKVAPEHYDEKEMLPFYDLCNAYIKKIWLRELQQEKFRPAEEVTERVLIHHINFMNVLKYMNNVVEVDLIFGPRNIGEQFTFGLYQLSVEDCKNLAMGINCLPVIKNFRVHRSNLTAQHVQAIVQAFVQNRTLIEVDFSHCKIGNQGACYFAELIRIHPTLEIVKLTNNLIENEGVRAITYILQTTNTCPLRHLDLHLNPLGSEGFRTIFSALIRNMEKPTELILSDIGFTEDVAILFGVVIIPMNKSLRVIDLSNNDIGVKGGRAIDEGLKRNTCILKLDLRSCKVDRETLYSIKKTLYRNDCFARKRPWSEHDVVPEEEVVEIASIHEDENVEDEEEEEGEEAS